MQGTVMGVIFPCMANILGVLLFLRLPWIVGAIVGIITDGTTGIAFVAQFPKQSSTLGVLAVLVLQISSSW